MGRTDVQTLLGDLDAAADALARAEPWTAEQRLVSAERRLGQLVSELARVRSADADALLRARTDLSVHLSAAGTLSDEGLHHRAAVVLDGAINAVRSRLA